MGKIQEVVEKLKKLLTHEIHSHRSKKARKLHEIQRGIKLHNSRSGQHRVVRVGTDMLEALAGGIGLLLLWRLSST